MAFAEVCAVLEGRAPKALPIYKAVPLDEWLSTKALTAKIGADPNSDNDRVRVAGVVGELRKKGLLESQRMGNGTSELEHRRFKLSQEPPESAKGRTGGNGNRTPASAPSVNIPDLVFRGSDSSDEVEAKLDAADKTHLTLALRVVPYDKWETAGQMAARCGMSPKEVAARLAPLYSYGLVDQKAVAKGKTLWQRRQRPTVRFSADLDDLEAIAARLQDLSDIFHSELPVIINLLHKAAERHRREIERMEGTKQLEGHIDDMKAVLARMSQ